MRAARALAAIGMLLAARGVAAGPCEDGFRADGDERNGLFFSTGVRLPGLSARSALGQLRQIATDGGYEPGSELLQGGSGELSFLQTRNRPALVVHATADNQGQVQLALKLAQGQQAPADGVRSEFCRLLGQLKTGSQGEAIAAAARASADRVVDADAAKLSADIGAEVKGVMNPVASKGWFAGGLFGNARRASEADFAAAFTPLRGKYMGRKYRIDGEVYTATFNQMTGEMEVNYLVTVTRGLLAVRQDSRFNSLNFQLTCVLAKDQARLFSTLLEGNHVRLSGEVVRFEPDGMRLGSCRQS